MRAERKRRLLLNGPQLDGEGIDQRAVDDLFGPVKVAERSAAKAGAKV